RLVTAVPAPAAGRWPPTPRSTPRGGMSRTRVTPAPRRGGRAPRVRRVRALGVLRGLLDRFAQFPVAPQEPRSWTGPRVATTHCPRGTAGTDPPCGDNHGKERAMVRRRVFRLIAILFTTWALLGASAAEA